LAVPEVLDAGPAVEPELLELLVAPPTAAELLGLRAEVAPP
jgi:hypothetical protein